jgi:signal transduction histidine kinase/ligand-binding sensor domain-containing protein
LLRPPAYLSPIATLSKLSFLVFWALMSLTCYGPRGRAAQLPIKTYTSKDGMSDDRLQHIMKDSRGFLWFSTSGGLSRFDGYSFTTYNIKSGLPCETVRYCLETRGGEYWVATDCGVYRFNPSGKGPAADGSGDTGDLFIRYKTGDDRLSQLVVTLFEDSHGRLWAGTRGGLFYLDAGDNREEFRHFQLNFLGSPNQVVGITALAEDAEGSLWILNRLSSLARVLPDGRILYYDESFGGYALSFDRDGRLWFGSYWDLYVINPIPASESREGDRFPWRELHDQSPKDEPSVRSFRYPSAAGEACKIVFSDLPIARTDRIPRGTVNGIFQASDGRVWVIQMHSGVLVFNGQSYQRFSTEQGIGRYLLVGLVEDNAGNIWVGSASNGAMKIASNGFASFFLADGIEHDHIRGVFEGQNGELYVKSNNWYVSRFDGNRFNEVLLNIPQKVRLMGWANFHLPYQDSRGEWWINSWQYLYRFPKVERIEQLAYTRPKAVYGAQNGLYYDSVTGLFEDSRGDIWIASNTANQDGRHCLSRWDRATESFVSYTEADGFPAFAHPTRFCEDAYGSVWMGLSEGGLVRHTRGQFTAFGEAAGIPRSPVQALFLDHAARLWVGTSSAGLLCLDDTRADDLRPRAFTIDDGLDSNEVLSLTEDEGHRLYIGAGRGIDRLDMDTLRVKHFTTADGLANNAVVSAYCDRNGRLWFGTLNGLSQFLPETKEEISSPPIFISGMKAPGLSRKISELGESDVRMPDFDWHQNQIQIDFFSLSFAPGDTLRYQYKIGDGGSDWSEPTELRSVNLNLSPGDYKFFVRAINANGGVSASPATVTFTILRPVWQRWWFLTLAVALVALLTYAAYRYRLARLLELERVRTRIATDLHDDIGASLSRMAILSEVVKQQTGALNLTTFHMLTEIADSARSLVDSMSDIVWSIDPRKDDLKSVAQRVRQFATDVLEARGIAWTFETPAELEAIKLPPDERRQLFLVFKEAVNNIAKHSGGTEARLRLAVEGGHLVAEIGDNGCGFELPDPEASFIGRGGNGLKNMQARASDVGGRLDVDSGSGSGSLIRLSLPIKKVNWGG